LTEDPHLPQLDRAVVAAVFELWREGRRPFSLRLEGRSMLPLAVPGDRVEIRPTGAEALRVGDLVALQLGERLVVHRLLRFRPGPDGARLLCQKGDNSPAWSWVDTALAIGRVAVITGSRGTLDLQRFPWAWINPLAGRLGRAGLGSHRLARLLTVPLVRLGLRLSK